MPKAEVMRCANKVSLIHNNTETDVAQVYCISKQEQTEQQNLIKYILWVFPTEITQTALKQTFIQAF